jgi:hypothetical protein
MERKELIEKLLWECWEDQCDRVGPANVNDIVEGGVEFTSPDGASKFSLDSALIVLVAAVAFINDASDLYIKIRDRNNKDPEGQSLKEEILAKGGEPAELKQTLSSMFYESLCNIMRELLKRTEAIDPSIKSKEQK